MVHGTRCNLSITADSKRQKGKAQFWRWQHNSHWSTFDVVVNSSALKEKNIKKACDVISHIN